MTIPEGAVGESPDADDGWIPAHVTPGGVEVIYLDHVRYERDPLSAVFDDIADDELDMLAANIDAEGQELPVTINRATGTVVDGWQRLRACHSIRKKPIVQEVDIQNPPAYVMAVNVHRRDVEAKNAAQRCLQAMDLFEADPNTRRKAGHKGTKTQIAAAAGISNPTVDMVRRALKWDRDHKNDDYEQALRRGRMSAARVYDEILQLEREERGEARDADAEGDRDDSRLNAVEQILREAGDREPVHYKEIFERGLERGLLRIQGRTSSNTLLKLIYDDIRRRDRRGNPPRFLPHGHGRIGIAAWAPRGLASLISEQNAEVRRALLDRARNSSSAEFEALVAALLSKMGFKDTHVTPLGGDGGIDVRGTRVEGAVHTRVAVQVKRWQANVQRPIVQQVRGSLGAHEQGWIITTSDFSSGAKEEATRADATPVALISGEQFAALLMEHGMGVRRETHDLFTLEEE